MIGRVSKGAWVVERLSPNGGLFVFKNMAVFSLPHVKNYYDEESGCNINNDRQAFELCKQSYYLKRQTEQNKSNNNSTNNQVTSSPETIDPKFEYINSELATLKQEINHIKSNGNNLEISYSNLIYFSAGVLLMLLFFILLRLFRKYGLRKK